MKTMNNAVLRSVFAFVLGLVLILWPEATINYLVIVIGILFIVPGLFSLISYFTRNRSESASARFPLEGAGSILFGGWLVSMPTFFVSIFMYVLGALLILGGVQQAVTLISARKLLPVAAWFYIVPLLLVAGGTVILCDPFQAATTTFIFFGVASVIYGVAEFVNWYKFSK